VMLTSPMRLYNALPLFNPIVFRLPARAHPSALEGRARPQDARSRMAPANCALADRGRARPPRDLNDVPEGSKPAHRRDAKPGLAWPLFLAWNFLKFRGYLLLANICWQIFCYISASTTPRGA